MYHNSDRSVRSADHSTLTLRKVRAVLELRHESLHHGVGTTTVTRGGVATRGSPRDQDPAGHCRCGPSSSYDTLLSPRFVPRPAPVFLHHGYCHIHRFATESLSPGLNHDSDTRRGWHHDNDSRRDLMRWIDTKIRDLIRWIDTKITTRGVWVRQTKSVC